MLSPIFVTIIFAVIILGGVLTAVAYMTWFERKIIGWIQLRHGVTHTGPFGLLQPLADLVKLITKEAIIPDKADKWLYILSPALVLIPAITLFALIPFTKNFALANTDISLLLVLALSSIGAYGILLAGHSSNSKYPTLSAIRVSAQMISYEVAMMLSLLAPIVVVGSVNLNEFVVYQSNHVWLIVPQFLGFFIYFTAAFAETNRLPFDLAEAENEIVAGFFTEYSALRFAQFFLAEYANMFVVAAIAATIFLGGWSGPFIHSVSEPFALILGFIYLSLKIFVLMFVFVWVRASFPRLRYDQLMSFGWKVLIPAALVNLFATAIIVYLLRM